MISHTYVMKSAMGSDGKPVKEQYFSHNYAARGEDGTIVFILSYFRELMVIWFSFLRSSKVTRTPPIKFKKSHWKKL